MRTMMRAALATSLLFLLAHPGMSQTADIQDKVNADLARAKAAALEKETEEKIARIEQLLVATPVDTKDLPREMPLAKVLAALEAKLPKGSGISLRLDEPAFGQELARVAGAPVRVPRVSDVSLGTVLRLVLKEADLADDVDYAIHPEGVLATRPPLAARTVRYDVRAVVNQVPRLLPQLKAHFGAVFPDLDTRDGPALLVRILGESVALKPWETVQVLNGARLVVHASPIRQAQVRELLELLRRLADVTVFMNARLYEVDRAVFAAHVAPLFGREKAPKEPPAVVPIDGVLLKKITGQKLLLESEETKVPPDERTAFLSRYDTYRYDAGTPSTGLAGVSFEVRAAVSADRRYLRLHLTQHVAQLVRIDKVKTLDAATGQEIEVESPNVRRTTVTGTVQIPDVGALLMPVDYRAPGAGTADKVWLLVAKPIIWIEEEAAEIRRQGKTITPRAAWEMEPEKPEPPPPRPPATDEVKEALQAVVTDVLNNPGLKFAREFYGTAADRTVALVDGDKLGWPAGFRPATHGFRLVDVPPDPFANRRRTLGICLEKLDLNKKPQGTDRPIEVIIFNAGGSANGGPTGGGCFVYYVPKRVDGRWTVELDGTLDP